MTNFTYEPGVRLRRLLTLPETAELLRKTESQLRWMLKVKSAPPHAKVGGRIVFDADEVAAWIDQQFAVAS
ncbi:helix-turn-helix domain-containing protein [Curtobacterium sp. A7_M15]|uniref:helix-turn-helix transcriptional regulator n=1 Tax=Curtobacterium sp. A7_M15 TaxID=3065241 RepID=UPI0027379222|nr:helix-turn-helix domain-containing protein [Curtobacterium sp. A7_M15]MDP4333221.1 helix-turn-helix domain-containing protein [Curtobacterium sp. A7_M15]